MLKRRLYFCRERPQSGCRNRRGRSFAVKALQTITAAQTANVLHRVDGFQAVLANSDELLHGLGLLVSFGQVPIAHGLPHELRDAGFPALGLGMKGVPEMLVEIELGPPHNV